MPQLRPKSNPVVGLLVKQKNRPSLSRRKFGSLETLPDSPPPGRDGCPQPSSASAHLRMVPVTTSEFSPAENHLLIRKSLSVAASNIVRQK